METNQDLEKKIQELETKLANQEKTKKNKNWIVNLIGWAVLIILFYIAWMQISPTIKNLNFLSSKAAGTLEKIDRGATQSNEVLDKVNHPIKNIDKFNPF